jgi:hypothetical protein
MIRLSITPAAFEAIAATLPLGSVGYERAPNAKGERLIWLEAAVVDRLTAMRGPGESYSDVILRLVESEARTAALSGPLTQASRRSPSFAFRSLLTPAERPAPIGDALVPEAGAP